MARRDGFRASEIAPGLWRWETAHPEWSPSSQPGSTADWPREVGSTAYLAEDAVAFFDPMLPEDGRTAFWRWADELVAERDGRVAALTTLGFHRRSRDAFVERYRASKSRARDKLPDGVVPIPIKRFGETMFWLERPRALIAGDRLLGSGDGELRLPPASWLGYLGGKVTLPGLAIALAPLLELPVETVLTSHGPPVLCGGRRAIGRALGMI